MNVLIGWLIALGSLAFYGGVGAVLGGTYYRRMEVTCRDSYCSHGVGVALGSVFWPIGVWLLVGYAIATRPERQEVEADQRARRLRELERETAVRCVHDNYTADCVRCRGVR